MKSFLLKIATLINFLENFCVLIYDIFFGEKMSCQPRKTYMQILEEIFREGLEERFGRFLSLEEIEERQTKELIRETLLKNGDISLPYVMRKFKCTETRAKELILNAT